ncbi:MAG: hypothetical protein AAF597_00695 [Bacteroidota bacterium]
MFGLRLTVFFLVVTTLACSGTVPGFPLEDLDFAEVRSTTGWQLRIHGDGSASLRHVQLPAHFLHYPAGTFDPRPARRLSRNCDRNLVLPVCNTLRYYTAFTDEEIKCNCAPGGWPTHVIEQAIEQMDLAVEGEGYRASRRMMSRLVL